MKLACKLRKTIVICILLCACINLILLLALERNIFQSHTWAHESLCAGLFTGNKDAQSEAFRQMNDFLLGKYEVFNRPDEYFTQLRCKSFLFYQNYVLRAIQEEKDFSIAYSIVVYRDLSQVEQLFRAIYRPQNAYCFHVDTKATASFKAGLKRLVSCFENVFISSRNVDVVWGTWTVLESDMICMKELLSFSKKWKYLINLTGQEFPLRTNLEIVRILKVLNGTNLVTSSPENLTDIRIPKGNPGFNLTWTKGHLHVLVKREFVEFMFSNPKSLKIMNMLKDVQIPDETFFSTLNYNPQLGAPGAFLGIPGRGPNYWNIPRLKDWGGRVCKSQNIVRGICIWGVLDLPLMSRSKSIFVNKLFWNFQPYALECLDWRIRTLTRRDFGENISYYEEPLDLTSYKNYEAVANHQ